MSKDEMNVVIESLLSRVSDLEDELASWYEELESLVNTCVDAKFYLLLNAVREIQEEWMKKNPSDWFLHEVKGNE